MPRVSRFWLAAAMAALTGSARAADAQERWYIVEILGQRAGHSVDRETTREDGVVVRETTMRLRIARGEMAIEIAVESRTEETAKGEPIAMTTTQRLGAEPLTTEYVFTPAGVEVRSTQGGRTTARTELAPGRDGVAWHMPAAAGRLLRDAVARGERTIAIATLDPSAGLTPVITTRTREADEVLRVAGRAVAATRWGVRHSAYPGVASTEWLDERGELVRGETNLGGLAMTLSLADRELALSPLSPPELLVSLLVSPDRPIASPRETARATYVLRAPAGARIPDLPTAGAQRWTRLEDGAVRVTVDLTDPVVEPAEVETADLLADSPMVDGGDPAIREALARAAVGDGPAAQRAERLRRFVHAHIEEKSLDVGFATASETVRAREGDCTEHAVLLAAMLRAAGVPSRTVSGLVYVERMAERENVFGFHMWTQALLPGPDGRVRWVDLDATLPGESASDATHIALVASAMRGEDGLNSMAALAPLLRGLEVRVERAEAR